MKAYMAPMEGITGYIYRRAHHQVYAPLDKYFTPFIVPSSAHAMRGREKRDVLPENNGGIPVVPQILTNSGEAFCELAKELEQLGYREVNLNLGCPSGTVVPKGKGAGALASPAALERMLEEIFRACPLRVSVKTRLGIEDPEEYRRLTPIYNQFPMEEVIVHPRVLKQHYKGQPDREAFREALQLSVHPLIWNGNLFTAQDVYNIEEMFPELTGVMLGRGLIANPGLWDEVLRGNPTSDLTKFVHFHDLVYAGHGEIQGGDRNLMFRMKELWYYMMDSFEDSDRAAKKLRKIQRAGEYEIWFRELIRTCPLNTTRGFRPPG